MRKNCNNDRHGRVVNPWSDCCCEQWVDLYPFQWSYFNIQDLLLPSPSRLMRLFSQNRVRFMVADKWFEVNLGWLFFFFSMSSLFHDADLKNINQCKATLTGHKRRPYFFSLTILGNPKRFNSLTVVKVSRMLL